MLYAGFVCQQQRAKFYDLEGVSYLRLRSITISKLLCQVLCLCIYLSLYVCYNARISVTVVILSLVYLLLC
jgi:hypothetical protein